MKHHNTKTIPFIENWKEWIEDRQRGSGLLLRRWPQVPRARIICLAASALNRRTRHEVMGSDWALMLDGCEEVFYTRSDYEQQHETPEWLRELEVDLLKRSTSIHGLEGALQFLDDLDAFMLAHAGFITWMHPDGGIEGRRAKIRKVPLDQRYDRWCNGISWLTWYAASQAFMRHGVKEWFQERDRSLSSDAIYLCRQAAKDAASMTPTELAIVSSAAWIRRGAMPT